MAFHVSDWRVFAGHLIPTNPQAIPHCALRHFNATLTTMSIGIALARLSLLLAIVLACLWVRSLYATDFFTASRRAEAPAKGGGTFGTQDRAFVILWGGGRIGFVAKVMHCPEESHWIQTPSHTWHPALETGFEVYFPGWDLPVQWHYAGIAAGINNGKPHKINGNTELAVSIVVPFAILLPISALPLLIWLSVPYLKRARPRVLQHFGQLSPARSSILPFGRIVTASICATLIFAWIHSYIAKDTFEYSLNGYRIESFNGEIGIFRNKNLDNPPVDTERYWRFTHVYRSDLPSQAWARYLHYSAFTTVPSHIGFGVRNEREIRSDQYWSNGHEQSTATYLCQAIVLPLWFAVLVTAIWPSIWLIGRIKNRRSRLPGVCRQCGYDLRASPDRCPECGTVVTNASKKLSA